jgi:hypothetical protein
MVVMGTIIFQMALAMTLMIGIDPVYLKLFTALFVLLIVSLPKFGLISFKMMINLQNITHVFNKGQSNEVKAINGLNLEIPESEFVVLIGANGFLVNLLCSI